MNNLNGINEKLAEGGFLKRLNIEKRLIDNWYYLDLEILLSCDANYSKDFALIKFYNVQELSMENINPILAIQFAIYNKSDCQLENTNFYVCDEENDTFSFYCERITFNDESIIH